MPNANAMERKRTVGKPATVSKYDGPSGGSVYPDFSADVQNIATPQRAAHDLSWMKNPAFASFVEEGKKIIVDGRPLAGNDLANWVRKRAFPDVDKVDPPTKTSSRGGGTMTTQNAPLMSALTQYATNLNNSAVNPAINAGYGQLSTDAQARSKAQQDAIDLFYGGVETQLGGLNADALAMLQNMYNQTAGEITTQSDAGRATIDESTQRALAALGGQSNPYAGLQMANIGAVSDPMAGYSKAVGAPQGGIDALQQMLQSQNATTGGGFSNLAQLLGASNQAAQQSRIGDVSVARAGAQQDLSANQRAAGLQALQQSQLAQQAQQAQFAQAMQQLGQSKLQSGILNQNSLGDFLNQLGLGQLQGNLTQTSNTQNRQDILMQQLLGLAGQGVDISKIMALLGGQ
jgi:hypothetical protein